jgi:arylsulfatase A-like enzyme
VDATPAMNVDLLPTFLGLAGVTLPADRTIDGVDLSPLLRAEVEGLPERPLFFSKDHDVEAVRVGRWKYVERNSHYTWPFPLDKPDTSVAWVTTSRDYAPPGGGPPIPTLGTWPLLYDLERDPAEAYDVHDRHPEVARRLAETLAAFRAELWRDPRGWLD